MNGKTSGPYAGVCAVRYQVDCLAFASLSLGTLWTWFMFLGNPGGLILGVSFEHSLVYRSAYQLLAALFMAALSFFRTPFGRVSFLRQVWLGASGCVFACVCFRLGYAIGSGALIACSNMVAALSYAVLLRCWAWRYRAPLRWSLFAVFAASSLCLLVHMSSLVFGTEQNTSLAVVAAVACAAVFTINGAGTAVPREITPRQSEKDPHFAGTRFYARLFALALCSLASGFLHFNVVGGDKTWAYCSLICACALAFTIG